MASRRARRSAAETWQLIPAAKCRPKSGCKDAFDLPLFFCLALRRAQYLRHQCSAGFPPSARSACPHRARRNRKAAQPSTDAQSLRAPLAVVGAALFGREITGRFRISPSCALTGIRSLIVLLPAALHHLQTGSAAVLLRLLYKYICKCRNRCPGYRPKMKGPLLASWSVSIP